MTKTLDDLRAFFSVAGARYEREARCASAMPGTLESRLFPDATITSNCTAEMRALLAEADRLYQLLTERDAQCVQAWAQYDAKQKRVAELEAENATLEQRIVELSSLNDTLERQITMRDTDDESFRLDDDDE